MARPRLTWRRWDPRRYGNWMTTEYAARKNEECYDHVFILHHPDEEREACRPLRTAPVYDRQKPWRAVWPSERLGTPDLLMAP